MLIKTKHEKGDFGPKSKNEKRMNKKIIIIITVLLLVAIGIGCFFILTQNQKPEPQPQPTEPPTIVTEPPTPPTIETTPTQTDWSKAYDNFLQNYDFSSYNTQMVVSGTQKEYVVAQNDSMTYEMWADMTTSEAVCKEWRTATSKTTVLTARIDGQRRVYYTVSEYGPDEKYEPVSEQLFAFPYDSADIYYDMETMIDAVPHDVLKAVYTSESRTERYKQYLETLEPVKKPNEQMEIDSNDETFLLYVIKCEYQGQVIEFEYILANGTPNFGDTAPSEFNSLENPNTPWRINLETKTISNGSVSIPFEITMQTDDPTATLEPVEPIVLPEIDAYIYINRDTQKITKVQINTEDIWTEVYYKSEPIPAQAIPPEAEEISPTQMNYFRAQTFNTILGGFEG